MPRRMDHDHHLAEVMLIPYHGSPPPCLLYRCSDRLTLSLIYIVCYYSYGFSQTRRIHKKNDGNHGEHTRTRVCASYILPLQARFHQVLETFLDSIQCARFGKVSHCPGLTAFFPKVVLNMSRHKHNSGSGVATTSLVDQATGIYAAHYRHLRRCTRPR